ncbi:hypothetical protein [Derxia lacustris]|uniref:hypothetical protein n=1 Tax=Derxia lacustris TaxID=764842 RepID=UPI000A172327|nr:hypothetical protein [Derxia lacustris]
MNFPISSVLGLAVVALALTACSRHEPPAPATAAPQPQSELGRAAADALHRPLDAAKGVEATQMQHGDDTRRQIDEASR